MPARFLAGDRPEPHRSCGTGKIITSARYGHIEVTAEPKAKPGEAEVLWRVAARSIQENVRDGVMQASLSLLEELNSSGVLRCGVRVTIEDATWHEALESAHTEAARLAVMNALEKGRFLLTD